MPPWFPFAMIAIGCSRANKRGPVKDPRMSSSTYVLLLNSVEAFELSAVSTLLAQPVYT